MYNICLHRAGCLDKPGPKNTGAAPAQPHQLRKGRFMLRVGFIGWRGMVGSVLMQRMR